MSRMVITMTFICYLPILLCQTKKYFMEYWMSAGFNQILLRCKDLREFFNWSVYFRVKLPYINERHFFEFFPWIIHISGSNFLNIVISLYRECYSCCLVHSCQTTPALHNFISARKDWIRYEQNFSFLFLKPDSHWICFLP